ncbi:MAG: SusC/RagA family TonB-linked outer membrane protein [Dysgonamonadaceae bacterium]|nr:SusC/RagA family TonB-linked outer membrane protein [Dysgonamonadaceae bacterium]
MMRGRVTTDNGEALMSVQVLEIDKSNRVVGNTTTDMNGDFVLKIYSTENQVRFNYIGFRVETYPIGTRRSFNIVLRDENVLEAVVVQAQRLTSIGTLEIPENQISVAVQKINTKDFEGIQVTSIDDALQGQISGLDIISSGDLGKKASMRIRGTSSINSNVDPLIVVNDIPREDISVRESGIDVNSANEDQFAELLSLNPDDIAEIQVFKDAASTAQWGSRGANGVISIKTKKGATGPTRVDYTYKFSGSKQPTGLKMLNGDDYTMMMKQALFNPRLDNSDSNIHEFNYDTSWSEYPYYSANTDWRKAVIQTGNTHDHYLAISGGGEKATFRVTGGYMTQRGTVIGQSLDRLTSMMDLNYYVSDRITFTSEFSFTYTDNDRNWTDGGSMLDIAYKKMPNLAIYNKDKDGNDMNSYYNVPDGSSHLQSQKDLRNPVAVARLATNNLKSYSVQPVLRLRYKILDREQGDNTSLDYNVLVSFNMRNTRTRKYLPREVSSKVWNDENVNKASNIDDENFTVQTENSLSWKPYLGDDQSLIVNGTLQTSSGNSNSQEILAYGFPSSEITNPTAQGVLKEIKSSIGQNRSLGMLARVHYSLKERYVVGLTYRRDGSTRFGPSHKWGDFPAVSLRWNISEEPFMDFSDDWLSMLSIRPSWGITGNAPNRDYMHFSKYRSSNSSYGYGEYASPVVYPENIRLSNLRWEKTTGINLGFDIGFRDNYFVDLNLYQNKTRDLLFADPKIPTSSGYSRLAYKNAGSLKNEGWELAFRAERVLNIGDVSFDFRFNLANSVNTLLKLDEDILSTYNKQFGYKNLDPRDGNEGTGYLQRMQVGKSYGSIYGFRYQGVYQWSADSYRTAEANNETAPVARDANGKFLLDSNGNPVPMYFNYYEAENANRYEFRAGDAIYEDINKDGTIDELDIVYLGNSNPLLNGGVGFTVRWKQLSANVFTTFRYGNKIVNRSRMEAESMSTFNNQSIAVNWRWRKEGEFRQIPRALYDFGGTTYNSLPSDRYVEDGSYFRMKYVTLTYNVPSASLKNFGLRRLSLYLTVNNLFTLTKYTGVDPEIDYGKFGLTKDDANTPRTKDFTLSVSLGF